METIVPLSPLDQITTRMYVEVFIFLRTDNASRDEIAERLGNALSDLSSTSPILKAKLRAHPSRAGRVEAFFTPESKIKFVVETHDDITYGKLKESDFVLSKEHGELFSAYRPAPPPCEEFPTMLVKANFVDNGLVLSLVIYHSAADGESCGTVTDYLARSCAGDLSSEVVSEMQYPHLTADDGMPLDKAIALEGPLPDAPSYVHDATHRFYKIEKETVETFKKQVVEALKSDDEKSNPWISSFDVVAAFIWSCVQRARAHLLNPDSQSSLFIALNVRPYLKPSVPSRYIGNCIIGIAATRDLSEVTSATDIEDIATLAASVRAAHSADINFDNETRAEMALIDAKEDLTRAVTAISYPPGTLAFTSWAKNRIGRVDFGPGMGRPDAVRRVPGPEMNGFCGIGPTEADGATKFYVCLEPEALEKLERDPRWNEVVGILGRSKQANGI